MSAYDEMERAVTDMRASFLSIGERIAGLLAVLARHIDMAPAHARASIRHAAEQIAGTQQRLRTQMAGLPARLDERYQIMQSLLQAQQGALQQLTIIVEQHMPQAAALPHQTMGPYTQGPGQAYARAPAGAEPEWPYEGPPMPQSGSAAAGRALADAHFNHPMPGEKPMPRPARTRPQRRPIGRLRRGRESVAEVVRSRMLLVLAALVAATAAAYLYFPGADAPQLGDRSRPATVVAREEAAATDSAALADSPSGSDRGALPLPRGVVLVRPQAALEEPAGGGAAMPRPDLPAKAQPLPETREGDAAPAARRTRDPIPAAEPAKSPIAAAESEVASAEPAAPSRFVAVVFTHQERSAALDTFADLQQRYPGVLGRRKAEAQPIEIADKGTWHRLVVLPAGSRQSASALCDRLQAAGYDRCWVKAY